MKASDTGGRSHQAHRSRGYVPPDDRWSSRRPGSRLEISGLGDHALGREQPGQNLALHQQRETIAGSKCCYRSRYFATADETFAEDGLLSDFC